MKRQAFRCRCDGKSDCVTCGNRRRIYRDTFEPGERSGVRKSVVAFSNYGRWRKQARYKA